MKIKVLVLEFTFFSGVEWDDVTIEITATNRIQLIRAFIDETRFIHSYIGEDPRLLRKKLWDKCKSYIEVSELEFPIIRNL